MKSRAIIWVVGVVAVAGWSASARDDFLRATSRDLSVKERQALATRIEELGSADPLVRQRSVRRLVAIGQPAVAELLEVLRHGSEPKQVRNACLALGALGDATSLALLERWLLEEARSEEPSRTALLALARGRTPLSLDFSAALRRLALDAPLATVRESALLCAGARRIGGIASLLQGPLQSERSARVRGCMLVALAESGDAAGAAQLPRFLDGRQGRDPKLRRAALYAASRLGDPLLLPVLLRFEPDRFEVGEFALALGAFAEPAVVDRLGDLLRHHRESAAVAVYSLAQIATPEAKAWLERALQGEFSEVVRSAAALSVADLVDQQRFLRHLRTIALGPTGVPGKAAALLALARIGDAEAAASVADALPLWRDAPLVERGLLLCALTLERPVEELLPAARRDTVPDLWRVAAEIQAGTRDTRLLRERVAEQLTASRGHWLLARDDLRMAVLRDLLELDRDLPRERRADSPDGGFGELPSSPPPASGGSGEGGDAGGGGDGGASDEPDPPRVGDPPGSAVPGVSQRRGRRDPNRIELDLRAWLSDFSPFDTADPFAR